MHERRSRVFKNRIGGATAASVICALLYVGAPQIVWAEGAGDKRDVFERLDHEPQEAPIDPEATSPKHSDVDDESLKRFDRQMRIAGEALRTGNLKMASIFYTRAHETVPEDPEPLMRLAELYKQIGDTASLEQVHLRLLALMPDDTELAIEHGLNLLRAGKLFEARIALHRALDKKEDPRIYNALGVAFDIEGDHDSAQAHYRIALEMSPDYLSAMANLGLSLALAKDFPEAIRILTMLSEHPKSKEEHLAVLDRVYEMASSNPQ